MQIIREHKTFAILIFLAMLFASGGVLSSCFFESNTETCGKDLRCRPGQTCAAHQAVCVDINGCGDGVISGDEICDDGNIIDGDNCSHDCKSDEKCGNGIVDIAKNEECDTTDIPTLDCNIDCKIIKRCGNSIWEAFYEDPQDPREQCDTGGDSITCDKDCTFVSCQDGYTNSAAMETCIAEGGVDQPDCDGDCTQPMCGDGRTNVFFKPDLPGAALESCDTRGDTSSCNGSAGNSPTGLGHCQRPSCGDWYTNGAYSPPGNAGAAEECDAGPGGSQFCNGNANAVLEIPGPGNCRAPLCGDGYTNTQHKPDLPDALFEQCDDGRDSDTCNGNQGANTTGRGYCQPARCGDGYRNLESVSYIIRNPDGTSRIGKREQCDAGANSPTCNGNDRDNNGVDDGPDGGFGNCQIAACGDSYYNPEREQCEWNAPNGSMNCAADEVCGQTGTNACKCIEQMPNAR